MVFGCFKSKADSSLGRPLSPLRAPAASACTGQPEEGPPRYPVGGVSGLLVHSKGGGGCPVAQEGLVQVQLDGCANFCCLTAPEGVAHYAELLSELADKDGMFKAALWAFANMHDMPSRPRFLLLEVMPPPSWATARSRSGSISPLSAHLRLCYTWSNVPGSNAVPALRIEHLSSREEFEASSAHTPVRKCAEDGNPAASEPLQCAYSQAAAKGMSVLQSATPLCRPEVVPPGPSPEEKRQKRKSLMTGEASLSLTLFNQEGCVLEQNFNSLLYYGFLKGKGMWAGNLQDQLAEPAAGPLQQLFLHAPDQLHALLQHLLLPCSQPWKAIIQVPLSGCSHETAMGADMLQKPLLGHEPACLPAPSPFAEPAQGHLGTSTQSGQLQSSQMPPSSQVPQTSGISGTQTRSSFTEVTSYLEERAASLERVPRRNMSSGMLTNRASMQHSRLATQLAAKKKYHTFHERNSQIGTQALAEQQASIAELPAVASAGRPQLKRVLTDLSLSKARDDLSLGTGSSCCQTQASGAGANAQAQPVLHKTANAGFQLVDWGPGHLDLGSSIASGVQQQMQESPWLDTQQPSQLPMQQEGATLKGQAMRACRVHLASTDLQDLHELSITSRAQESAVAACARTGDVGMRHTSSSIRSSKDFAVDTNCKDATMESSSTQMQQANVHRPAVPNRSSLDWRLSKTIEEEAQDREQELEGSRKESMQSPSECCMYHEIEVKLMVDPVSGRPAFLLLQRDVTEQVELENLLAELVEDQLAMLSQIFPRHVIQALSTDGAVNLDNIASLTYSHEGVTILFLDIVSFTSMCGKDSVTPESVITFLNLLFSQFDKLVQKYQVQKIDVIGDAYLVASGILVPDGDGFWTVDTAHNPSWGAGRVMALAVDMMRVAQEVRMPDGRPVQLRIGLHTGPCVSGLVGFEVPKWSIFGDTVNTSARMEQSAAAGTIQLSEATKSLLPADLKLGLVASGGVLAKGKGCMDTWIWKVPFDWQKARQAGLLPPMPAQIVKLCQQSGLDIQFDELLDEDMPTVQLPTVMLLPKLQPPEAAGQPAPAVWDHGKASTGGIHAHGTFARGQLCSSPETNTCRSELMLHGDVASGGAPSHLVAPNAFQAKNDMGVILEDSTTLKEALSKSLISVPQDRPHLEQSHQQCSLYTHALQRISHAPTTIPLCPQALAGSAASLPLLKVRAVQGLLAEQAGAACTREAGQPDSRTGTAKEGLQMGKGLQGGRLHTQPASESHSRASQCRGVPIGGKDLAEDESDDRLSMVTPSLFDAHWSSVCLCTSPAQSSSQESNQDWRRLYLPSAGARLTSRGSRAHSFPHGFPSRLSEPRTSQGTSGMAIPDPALYAHSAIAACTSSRSVPLPAICPSMSRVGSSLARHNRDASSHLNAPPRKRRSCPMHRAAAPRSARIVPRVHFWDQRLRRSTSWHNDSQLPSLARPLKVTPVRTFLLRAAYPLCTPPALPSQGVVSLPRPGCTVAASGPATLDIYGPTAPSSAKLTPSSGSMAATAKEEGSFSMSLQHVGRRDMPTSSSAAKGQAGPLAPKLAFSGKTGLQRVSSLRPFTPRSRLAHAPPAMSSPANAIMPSGSVYKSLAVAHTLNVMPAPGQQQRRVSARPALPRRMAHVSMGSNLQGTAGMSSPANTMMPSGSVYKALAKAHAYIGTLVPDEPQTKRNAGSAASQRGDNLFKQQQQQQQRQQEST